MNKLKLALVSYINTIPFIEGINASDQLSNQLDLIIDYPAKCAELIQNKEVDGGLIPVAALSSIDQYEVFTDYCIGANGNVDTVALFSNDAIMDVENIYLDYQSRTSVQLVKILAREYWKRDFKFLPTTEGFEDKLPANSAILIIGDRVFQYEHLYKNKLDLANEWKIHTGLPFAFAVWVGNEKLRGLENELNAAFEKSMKEIPSYYSSLLTIDEEIFINYLSQKIQYSLDEGKKEAIQLFTSLLDNC